MKLFWGEPYLSAEQIFAILDDSTYRVYAKYERRVGLNHGRRIFDDTPQSVHIQVEDHNHYYCTDGKNRHSSQIYGCNEQKINRYKL